MIFFFGQKGQKHGKIDIFSIFEKNYFLVVGLRKFHERRKISKSNSTVKKSKNCFFGQKGQKHGKIDIFAIFEKNYFLVVGLRKFHELRKISKFNLKKNFSKIVLNTFFCMSAKFFLKKNFS